MHLTYIGKHELCDCCSSRRLFEPNQADKYDLRPRIIRCDQGLKSRCGYRGDKRLLMTDVDATATVSVLFKILCLE